MAAGAAEEAGEEGFWRRSQLRNWGSCCLAARSNLVRRSAQGNTLATLLGVRVVLLLTTRPDGEGALLGLWAPGSLFRRFSMVNEVLLLSERPIFLWEVTLMSLSNCP